MKLLPIVLSSVFGYEFHQSEGTDVEAKEGIYTEFEYNELKGRVEKKSSIVKIFS